MSSPSLADAATAPPTPAHDAFYAAPNDLSSYRNGEIIRSRPIDATLAGGLPLTAAHAYQLLYRTSDGYGRKLANVTTVIVPDGPRPDEILFCLVMASGPRVHNRMGGLATADVKGEDGLR